MKVLLDTHTFIWADAEPHRLSGVVAEAIRDPGNEVLLSVVSLWEIQIKVMLGKLALRAPLEQILDDQDANGISMLELTTGHVLALSALPPLHRDPFDRMLAAQASAENAVLATGDQTLATYPIRTLW
ncbi:MAG: type II toxin-antitoxin system VapC family toxin [Bacteroidota bacterium]